MYSTKRLMLRGFDWERDGNLMITSGADAAFLDLMTSIPRMPKTKEQVKSRFGNEAVSELPRFTICLKPEGPLETSWPHNLKTTDDYYATAPEAIGFINFQDKEFDFKNRVSYIGISLYAKEHRGKGYGTEVLQWALQYGFEELGLHKIGLMFYENNEGAKKTYEKAGFVWEGRLRKNYWQGGRWWDTIMMSVLEEDWFERKRLGQQQNGTSTAVS